MTAPPNASSAWFKKADGDLFGADAIQKSSNASSPHWDLVLFLAHQATEKFLKGCLAAEHLAIPKTHDLPALLQSCAFLTEFLALESDCDEVHGLYIGSRYPGMQDVTELQANKAVDVALRVKSIARRKYSS